MKYNKLIVTCMLVFLILFTISCLIIVATVQYEPSTLITSVFGFCGIEGGLLAWIKNTDTKTKKGD